MLEERSFGDVFGGFYDWHVGKRCSPEVQGGHPDLVLQAYLVLPRKKQEAGFTRVYTGNTTLKILCALLLTTGPGMPRRPSGPGFPAGPCGPTGPVFPGAPSAPGSPWKEQTRSEKGDWLRLAVEGCTRGKVIFKSHGSAQDDFQSEMSVAS